MKLNKVIGYLNALLSMSLGLLFFIGLIYDSGSWLLNTLVGVVSIAIGFVFYKRTRAMKVLKGDQFVSFIRYDILSSSLALFVVSLLFAMAFYRVFVENYAVFG
ncbi:MULTISPECIES: hypothetical protein [Myroides]|uniref:Uncharacterized protein n=1 Tax=Myroides albus TaxID=2562892 RepID=A0A6I3LMC3_9FLAO|nr:MULTISPECIES: hypothetical protein [Myroides]MTG97731.1 hypothetical protein [Myroides albus]MVX34901.1 hypothetical protein [Myroides sp. LoEW2-1]UVD78720.1 hypothetical protein NWE55_11400 [Myroides albus]